MGIQASGSDGLCVCVKGNQRKMFASFNYAIFASQKKVIYTICVAGKRRAPLEDCGGPWAFMALRDEYPLFEVIAQFAQLLLDHRDELDDYQEELRRLGYWIVYEHFDRQAVNRRLAANAATCTGEEERRL